MNKPKGGHGSINDLVGTAGLTALFVIGVFFSDTNIVRCAAGLAVLWDLKMSAGLVTVMALLPVFFISNGFSLFLLLHFFFLFDCGSSEHRCFLSVIQLSSFLQCCAWILYAGSTERQRWCCCSLYEVGISPWLH